MHTRLADLRNQHNLGQKQVADIIALPGIRTVIMKQANGRCLMNH
ncbi:hypothetical protein [Geomicrobium sp. JCM 19037]|nr:hypothetical protein [Geomicrobium sp. JCM 19037]